MFNPPFVRHVATADVVTDERTWGRLAVAAVGDGSIAFFDVEAEPSSSSSSGSSGGKKPLKKGAAEKGLSAEKSSAATGASGDGKTCPSPEQLLPRLRLSLDVMSGGHTAAASCCCFFPGSLDLSSSDYGTQEQQEDRAEGWRGEMLLASAGDDRRVLLWSVPRAVAFTWHEKRRLESAPGLGEEKELTVQCHVPSQQRPLVLDTKHGRKINGMCVSLDASVGGNRMLHVADTGRLLTSYRLLQSSTI